MIPDLPAVVSQFILEGELLDVAPCGSGHIHDTFVSRFQSGRGIVRYIHQRINHHVFRDPERLMQNIERVTCHARERIRAAGGDPARETLTLVPTRDGSSYYCSPQGDYWRTYLFVQGAQTYDQPREPRQVYTAANAFGRFQTLMLDLPGGKLHDTIPNFHHTPKRFQAFSAALARDGENRARFAKEEIALALARERDTAVVVDLLAAGRIPERVTHNDTKLNNVLIDDITGEGICVIDLDTVMTGSVLYDFGDMVRSGTCFAAEDERDLDKVKLDLRLFELIVRGYLDATRDWLTPTEIEYLAFSGRLITLQQALRFLTDYLSGDVYFKVHRPGHNLDRCRTQFRLLLQLEAKSDQLNALVRRYRVAGNVN
jgi:hypothetical protein